MLKHLQPSASVSIGQAARRRASGVTLIEVLVALVVISVGLLGIAALQMVSLRNSQASYLRTQATALAQDIIDRMRANRTAALASDHPYNIAIGTTVTLGGTPTRAQQDLSEWKDSLKTNLPTTVGGAVADGSIQINGNIVTVTIQWGERDTSDRDTRNSANPAGGIIHMQFVTTTEI